MHNRSYIYSSFLLVALFFSFSAPVMSQCEPVSFHIEDYRGINGETVCFDVRVRGFVDMNLILIPFSFDPNILRYNRCENGPNFIYDCESLNPPDKLAAGIYQLFWSSPSASDNLNLVDDDVLITLCFDVIGEVGDVTKLIPGDVPALGIIPGVILEVFRQNCDDAITSDDIVDSDIGDFRVTCGSFDVGQVSCPSGAGESNGSVRFTLCGDEGPYSYQLVGSTASGTANSLEEIFIENLAPGNYQLDVQTSGGVAVPLPGGSDIVIPAGDPMIVTFDSQGPACPEATPNGFIEAIVTGGTPDYSYSWSTTGVNIKTLTGLSAGDYALTVTDASGCAAVVDNIPLEFNSIQIEDLQVTPASCAGSRSGSVALRISGGIPQLRTGGILRYRVAINGGRSAPYDISPNPAEPASTIDLEPGDYSIRVFDNSPPREACFVDATFTIGASKNYTIDLNAANNDCTQGGVVSINTRAEGGSSPLSSDLTYNIFDANGTMVDFFNTSDLTHQFTGLPEGRYTVTVVDNADGCTFPSDINDPAIVGPPGDGLMLNYNVVQPLACGQDAIIEITGLDPDVSDFTFEWNNGTTIIGNNMIAVGVEDNYNVTVTDPSGCEGDLDGNLIQIRDVSENLNFNDPNSIVAEVASEDCFGNPGSIELEIGDARVAAMATYTWFQDGTPIAGETSNTIAGLAAGNYSVEITGTNICPVSEDFVIAPGSPIVVNLIQDELKCFGEAANFSFQLENATGVTNYSIQNTETLEFLPEKNFFTNSDNVPGGTYQITGEDEVGCPIDGLIVVEEHPELTINTGGIDTIDNRCFGLSQGSAVVDPSSITGGAGGEIFYSWVDNNDPGVTLSDQSSISDLSNGSYTLVYFDAECQGRTSFDITSPEKIVIDDVATIINQPTCYEDADGGAEIMITGGSGTFDQFILTNQETGARNPFPTNMITGLPEGNYRVQITDDTGCAGLDSIIITQPDSLLIAVDSMAVVRLSCNADEVGIIRTITQGGNNGTFTYGWSHEPNLNSPVATNLGEEVYTISVVDSKGCTASTEYEMQSPTPIALDNFDTIQFVQCFGDRLLFGGLAPTGGNDAGYRYSINNGNLMQLSDSILLSAGSYNLEIRDQDGCPLDTSFVVIEPNEVVVELGPDVEINLGDSHQLRAEHDPEEVVTTYMWDPLDPDESPPGQVYTVSPMDDTVYGVRIENDQGCSDEDEVMIRVRRDRNVYIPEIIRTGSNDVNAVFAIFTGQGVERIDVLRIFDRWGNLVHKADQLAGNPLGTGKWDARLNGTLVEAGVYVYFARVLFTDGDIVEYKGDFTVVH